jgi:2-oxoglutarate ferredoxin oxidoreductase subunit alpha
LKAEAIGLAVMAELPLVVINVQRAGPSTGMPTKTQQADLLQAMHGRNGESPVAILAPSTPGDAFECGFEAVRIALQFMTPVIVLSDGYIANGSEPWLLPDIEQLPKIGVKFAPEQTSGEKFMPYARDPKTLARVWAKPGTKGLTHRIGGLEKADLTGNISYEPANHQHMVDTRAKKIANIADAVGEATTFGPDSGDILVLGWGSTRGAITSAVLQMQEQGHKVSACFLRWLNPLPRNLGKLLKQYKRVILPELNKGQLCSMIRAKYLVDVDSYSKVDGQPFKSQEVLDYLNNAMTRLKGGK